MGLVSPDDDTDDLNLLKDSPHTRPEFHQIQVSRDSSAGSSIFGDVILPEYEEITIDENGYVSGHGPGENYEKKKSDDNDINNKGKQNPKKQTIGKAPTIVRYHELTSATKELPVLEAWLLKKRLKKPHIYQKRWVIVAKPYVLWNKTQKSIQELSFVCCKFFNVLFIPFFFLLKCFL